MRVDVCYNHNVSMGLKKRNRFCFNLEIILDLRKVFRAQG